MQIGPRRDKLTIRGLIKTKEGHDLLKIRMPLMNPYSKGLNGTINRKNATMTEPLYVFPRQRQGISKIYFLPSSSGNDGARLVS
jgi:hypothetical protein